MGAHEIILFAYRAIFAMAERFRQIAIDVGAIAHLPPIAACDSILRMARNTGA